MKGKGAAASINRWRIFQSSGSQPRCGSDVQFECGLLRWSRAGSTRTGGGDKKNDFMTFTTWHLLSLTSQSAILPRNSSKQPHLVPSEYLWMLLGGRILLSERLPGTGLAVLSPRSRPSRSLALHPIAVCISPFLAATSVARVMEKNER